MKKAGLVNTITTILGILLFIFAWVAVWYTKMTVPQALMVAPLSLLLVMVGNNALSKLLTDLLYKLLKVKKDDA